MLFFHSASPCECDLTHANGIMAGLATPACTGPPFHNRFLVQELPGWHIEWSGAHPRSTHHCPGIPCPGDKFRPACAGRSPHSCMHAVTSLRWPLPGDYGHVCSAALACPWSCTQTERMHDKSADLCCLRLESVRCVATATLRDVLLRHGPRSCELLDVLLA